MLELPTEDIKPDEAKYSDLDIDEIIESIKIAEEELLAAITSNLAESDLEQSNYACEEE